MSTPYLGEIKVISFNFAPKGWALCNGQLLPINQNQALFSILGTTYGGNGQTDFALPNLQGRMPVHVGNGIVLGESAGEEAHTLTVGELPAHSHPALARTAVAATEPGTSPAGALWAGSGKVAFAATANVAMNPQSVGAAGQSQPHTNLGPYLVLNFVIALQGIFPSRA